MFRVMTLHNLGPEDTRKAITEPLAGEPNEIKIFFDDFNNEIYDLTKGYPYFIQFWCRELYDYLDERSNADERDAHIIERITHKLDMDFFESRWARLTDRQRDLLTVIALLENSGTEFTVQEIVEKSKSTGRAFSGSHVNQMLTALFNKGMVIKNRHGRYILAVPLLDEYIRRQRIGVENTG